MHLIVALPKIIYILFEIAFTTHIYDIIFFLPCKFMQAIFCF